MSSAFRLSVSGSGGPTINMRPVGVRRESAAFSTQEPSTSGDRNGQATTASPQLKSGALTELVLSMLNLIQVISQFASTKK